MATEELLLMLAGLTVPLVNLAKDGVLPSLQDRFKWNERQTSYAVLCLSVIVGIGLALLAGQDADIFAAADIHTFHPVVGIVAGGILVGFGSNWIHEAFKVLRGFAEWLRDKV